LRRDDHLPAALEPDTVLFAESLEQRSPPRAQRRLQRARLVVEPRVDDAAVAPRLVRRERALLLEHDERRSRAERQDRERRREPDDASSDDDDVCAHHSRERVRYHASRSMSQEHSAFRHVPRTGVIYVTTEAQKHGFSPADPEWC